MIAEISKAVGYWMQVGINQFLIFLTVVIGFIIVAVIINTFIEAVVTIVKTFFSFNKEKRYYKLVNRHMCWYRNRSAEILKDKKYDTALEFMDKSLKDMYEVLHHESFAKSESFSEESGTDINRSTTDKPESYGKVTD